MVLLLVWLHDYEKIIDFKNQYNTTHTVGSKKLLELGFNKEFAFVSMIKHPLTMSIWKVL